jgi:hypothetical protein
MASSLQRNMSSSSFPLFGQFGVPGRLQEVAVLECVADCDEQHSKYLSLGACLHHEKWNFQCGTRGRRAVERDLALLCCNLT